MLRAPELHDTVQDLSEALDRRLVVLDRTMRVAAYSIHESGEDRRRLSHVLTHSDAWDSPATGSQAGVVQDLDGVGPALMHRLLGAGGHVVGHLMIAPVNDGEVPALLRAIPAHGADRIGRLLEAWDASVQAQITRSGSLAVDLVADDDDRRAAAAETVLREEVFGASERYCAVAVGPGKRGASAAGRTRVEQAVAQTIRFVNETSTANVIGGVTGDGTGVLVFPRPVVAPRLARILSRPHLVPARSGIGPLATLTTLHGSFRRARWALRASTLAPSDHSSALHWSDAGVDGLVASMPLEDMSAADLPAPVRRILEDPRTRDWAPTLEALLEHAGDVQETARALMLHRSTVYYRLDRLADVAGTDLRDGTVRREIHLGLRIARLAGWLD